MMSSHQTSTNPFKSYSLIYDSSQANCLVFVWRAWRPCRPPCTPHKNLLRVSRARGVHFKNTIFTLYLMSYSIFSQSLEKNDYNTQKLWIPFCTCFNLINRSRNQTTKTGLINPQSCGQAGAPCPICMARLLARSSMTLSSSLPGAMTRDLPLIL